MAHHYQEEFLGIQFFGEFLIDHWIIKREQLLEALDYQTQRNLRFGEIAIKKDYLTQEQVIQINNAQRTSDQAFGALAVSMGLLDGQQLQEIITFQKNNNLYLGEVLLRLGFISEAVLEQELASFHENQKQYVAGHISVPDDVGGVDVIKAVVDFNSKMFKRLLGCPLKVGLGIILDADRLPLPTGYYLSVSVIFSGAASVQLILSVSQQLATLITSAILNEDAESENADIITDGVKEFCNILCGNSAAKLAQMGCQVDISAPEAYSDLPQPPAGSKTVSFPMRLTKGSVDLRFFVPAHGA